MRFPNSDPTDFILEKAVAGERIMPEEALALYDGADFLKVMAAARAVRNRLNNPGVVTYTMFRVVNYTTFCDVDCTFCSYAETMDSPRGETLTRDQVLEKMRSDNMARFDQIASELSLIQAAVDRIATVLQDVVSGGLNIRRGDQP